MRGKRNREGQPDGRIVGAGVGFAVEPGVGLDDVELDGT